MHKPVILLGNGIRKNTAFIEYLCSLNIPILTTWMAADLIPEDHPAYCGRPGLIGQRAANIIQQKAGKLYVFGARLDNDQVAYRYDNFAPKAGMIQVYDVDQAELDKLPQSWIKIRVNLTVMGWEIARPIPDVSDWTTWARNLYLSMRDETFQESHAYATYRGVMNWLSDNSKSDDVFAISSSGQTPCMFLQTYKVKAGQRILNMPTFGAMGADVPMAIGAAIAAPRRRIICPTGDGGFQLNKQELSTVKKRNLNIKFLVFENGGYNSIRQMQKKRFDGRLVACDKTSGLALPVIRNIAESYDIEHVYVTEDADLQSYSFKAAMQSRDPAIISVLVDPNFIQYPRVDSTMDANGVMQVDAMEDMTPKLDPDYLAELMRWGDD